MFPQSILKHVAVAVGLSLVVTAGAALGKSAEAAFYQAYYLEHDRGDAESAADLYVEALESGALKPKLAQQARAELAACREELACADFARLMPPDTLVYVEVNRPGAQLGDLLGMLGLLADPDSGGAEAAVIGGRHVAISPVLIEELMGVRGVAVALNGFNPADMTPAGVAVFHPGSVDAIRALIETTLPTAAEAVKPIQGYPTYHVEETVFVCLTSRLVVVSAQRPQIVAVLRRIEGKIDKSFATNEAMAEALQGRENAAMFFCVNAEPIVPMVTGLAGASRDLAMANALLDFGSVKWLAGSAGVTEQGLFVDLDIRLAQGHHNLAYNLVRTPPITSETLRCIPNGVAGFAAAALGEASVSGDPARSAVGAAAPAIIGLDFGRELFANIVDFAVYALPPAAATGIPEGPAPDMAAVIRVNDAAKSQVLWTQILGIASMAAGAPTTDGKVDRVGDVEVRTYKFPDGVVIRFATAGDKVLVATTRHAMQQTLETIGGGESILADEAFAASLTRITENTSKAMFVHPGRCFEVARRFMSPAEIKEAEPVLAMLTDLVASVQTDEAEDMFHVSAAATGLPDMGDFVAEMIQREQHEVKCSRELHSAMRAGQWDKALDAVDALFADAGDPAQHLRQRFNILATGKKDRQAALACAKTFMEQAGRDANRLNRLAWDMLTEERFAGQYNDLALEMAEQACALTGGRKWAHLDTRALAEFETGDLDGALESQREAIRLSGGKVAELQQRLARFEAAVKTGSADDRTEQ